MTDSNIFSHAEGEGYSSQLIHDSSPTVMKKVAIFFNVILSLLKEIIGRRGARQDTVTAVSIKCKENY